MEDVLNKIVEGAVDFSWKILFAGLIVVLGFKLVKFVMNRVKKAKVFNKLEKSTQTFISSILNILLRGIVVLTAITELGIPMTSIIAVIGSAGLALGLALQGGLSNIAGGVMIMLFKPFKVGDFIDTHTDSGTVKEINVFHTVLCTYDNKIIVIPNGELSNKTIVNASAMPKRLLDLEFSVDYRTDIDKVKEVLTEIANSSKFKIKEDDILVALKEQGDSALVFAFRIWVKSEDYWTAKFEILETVKKRFDEENISIPYPQLDVHLDK